MNKWIFRVGIVLCVMAAGRVAGINMTRQQTNSTDARLEQLRKEANEAAIQIDGLLSELLSLVNENQRPETAQVDDAVELLDQTKRFGTAFEDKDKAKFMLLQSWVYFFQDNAAQAVNWSGRSCKTYEPAKDPWVTQALFSLLNNKRPLKPRPPRPQRTQTQMPRTGRGGRAAEIVAAPSEPEPYSESGRLDFDLMGIRDEYLDKRFSRIEIPTVSGDSVAFAPQRDTLCILFNQKFEEAPVEVPDEVDERQQMQMQTQMQMSPYQPMRNPMVPEVQAPQRIKVDAQVQAAYFEMLAQACQEHDTVKFIQVNPEGSDTPAAAANEDIVPVASPGYALFKSIDTEESFMMIVDREGTTKYAGTASDFVPAFILTELTGIEIGLAAQNRGVQLETGRMLTHQGDPNSVPLRTIGDPNSISRPSQGRRPATQDSEFDQMQTQIEAEKLLQMAELQIGKGDEVRSNPSVGIAACRQILDEFPNTTYARQAQELLRRVPERYQRMNNITNEELGL